MSEWRTLTLGDLGVIKTGKTPLSAISDAYDGNIPFVTPKDMDGRKWIDATERNLSAAGLKSVKSYLVPQNAVAVSCIGSDMGKTALLSKASVTNQQINSIIVDASRFNPEFIYYDLSLRQEEIKGMASGSATPILNKGHFSKIEIRLPGKETQDEIVCLLSCMDDKIELNRQINQTLEQIAQATFNSWFVSFEPVKAKIKAKAEGYDPERAAMCAINGKTDSELDKLSAEHRQQLADTAALFPDELVESELGPIPKGWSLISLYDSATFINGTAFNTKDFSLKQEGLPIIKIAELKSGVSDQTKFSESTFPQKYQIDDHDVLYSWSGSPNTSLEVFKWFGGNHLLGLKDGKKRFLDVMASITRSFSLCGTLDGAAPLRKEIAFFSAIRAAIIKHTTIDSKLTEELKNSALKQILDNAIIAEGVADIFKLAGLDKPNISLLSDEFLEDVRNMKSRNLAVELLEKLLRDEIRSRTRSNVVLEKKFGDRLLDALQRYHARAIETAQVIEELIQMAKDFKEAMKRDEALGLNPDEVAFYDALAYNESAVLELGDDILKKIAVEITEKLRNSTSVDWQVRESVRAKLRNLVRRTLRKWKYPPDKQDDAVELVLKQAEVLCSKWVA